MAELELAMDDLSTTEGRNGHIIDEGGATPPPPAPPKNRKRDACPDSFDAIDSMAISVCYLHIITCIQIIMSRLPKQNN